jgi:hypothetical protein
MGAFTMAMKLALAAAAFAVFMRPDDVIFTITFLASAHGGWVYTQSPTYMKFLKNKVYSMPVVAPVPIPEMDIKDFSREAMLKLSNGMADPIIIRGALKESEAVKQWGLDFFEENYGGEKVVVREMVEDVVRMQHRSFDDFMLMKAKGRNVSIVASSTMFNRNPLLKSQLMSPIEEYLVGPKGEPIIAHQFFITPGGRTWFHCAIGNNVFRQIVGQKRWTIIDPKKYNIHMCPVPVITGTSVTPCLEDTYFTADEKEEWITHIPRQSALLNPGDILINAGWWWHDVQSIGDSNSPIVSVAGRIKNLGATFANSPVLTTNAVAAKLLSKAANDAVDFEVSLEEGIVESWTRNCLARKRTDCVTPP